MDDMYFVTGHCAIRPSGRNGDRWKVDHVVTVVDSAKGWRKLNK